MTQARHFLFLVSLLFTFGTATSCASTDRLHVSVMLDQKIRVADVALEMCGKTIRANSSSGKRLLFDSIIDCEGMLRLAYQRSHRIEYFELVYVTVGFNKTTIALSFDGNKAIIHNHSID